MMSHSERSKRSKEEDSNYVHKEAIMKETIKKELKHHTPYTHFNINPFTPMYTVTGKPNSFLDAHVDQGIEDEQMKKLIRHSQKPPTEKFTQPQTSSQEYGWIHTPLHDLDRRDSRLYFPKRQTDVTETKEAEWKQKEQSENIY